MKWYKTTNRVLNIAGYRRHLAGITLLLVILCGCIKEDEPKSEIINYVGVGDTVPAFTVSDGIGGSFSSGAFTGKRTLLVLFHTGCGDCQRELPKVNKVWEQVREEGIQVITIAREEERASIDAFWTANQFSLPFYLDPDRVVFSLFANSTIPRLYIVSPDGIITWMAIESLGAMTTDALIQKIREA